MRRRIYVWRCEYCASSFRNRMAYDIHVDRCVHRSRR
jgi:hypothetical protein